MPYLLDTNVVSDIAQGNLPGKEKLFERFCALEPDEIAISTLTAYELHVGLARLPKSRLPTEMKQTLRARTLALINAMEVLPVSLEDSLSACLVQSYSQGLGFPMGGIEACIAGQASNRRLTLVSHDREAFSRLPNTLLDWVDWYEDS